MPVTSQGRFDELNPKYILACCHVKTAALVIGALQLIGFFCNLTTVALLRRDPRHPTMTMTSFVKTQPSSFDLNATPPNLGGSSASSSFSEMRTQGKETAEGVPSNDFWGQVVDGRWNMGGGDRMSTVASMDTAWSGVMAMCVVLSFYAIRFTRPYLLAPKLILDAVTAGLVSVGAATNLILVAGRTPTNHIAWSNLFIELVGALILLYIFGVSLHCFKYLMEKRAFLDSAPSGLMIFPLPANWLNPQTSNTTENSYDVPPAYPGPAQESKASAEPKPDDAESNPPSYEEAKKLGNPAAGGNSVNVV